MIETVCPTRMWLTSTASALPATTKVAVSAIVNSGCPLVTVLRWMKGFSIDIAHWPTSAAFMERVGERPAVKAALAAEAMAPSP
ncbi:hypothetical protein [Bradyrhizobium sp. WD16]|uniref:hypothetical protein n=1 Tax=Bradyrhizobium sp. WD16 TaxID=1521768 RepID=UPI0020A4B52D|nr:hypothetical protein [Bradyrhizobium sp. WD16]